MTALLLRLASYAQTNAADSLRAASVPADIDSSAIGKPVGSAATKTIGPEGGTLSSADGFMELSFPPGALAAPTSIGIQPIENTSMMNFGKTYACTPDGLHFQKPVGLVLHYTDSMAKGITTSIPTIRWQDKSGWWTCVEKIRLDSVAHTLTGRIEHFSGYSAATSFKVYPANISMKVGTKQLFTLVISGTYPDGKHYGGREGARSFWKEHNVEWSFYLPIGIDVTGTIVQSERPFVFSATYTAPDVIPSRPVTIEGKYMGFVALADGSFADGVFSLATVDVYDDFHYSFTGYDKVGHLEMIDSSGCDIRAYSSGKIELSNLQNHTPWSDWPAKIGQCSYDYPDKTGWKGMVEIAGLGSGTLQRPYPDVPGQPTVKKILITLAPAMGSSPPYTVHCKGVTSKVPSYPVQARPTDIQLELNLSGDIYIMYGSAGGLNTLKDIRGGQGFEISASKLR